jgi:hypothetical protein
MTSNITDFNRIQYHDISSKDYRKSGFEALVISGELGFAPLAALGDRSFFKQFSELTELSNEITLVKISKPSIGNLIICPSERSKAYLRLANPDFGRPYRDFYYNVSYEAFNLCRREWGAENIAMTHLCGGGGRFNDEPTIAACSIEAWSHLASGGRLGFIGCCIEEATIRKAKHLIQADPKPTRHKQIEITQLENILKGADVYQIKWP